MRFHFNFFLITLFYAVIFAFFFDFSLAFHKNVSRIYGCGLLFLLVGYLGWEWKQRLQRHQRGQRLQRRQQRRQNHQAWNQRYFLSNVSVLFFFLLGFCFHRDYVAFLEKQQELLAFSDFQATRQNTARRASKVWRGVIESDHHFNGKHYVLRMRLLPLAGDVEVTEDAETAGDDEVVKTAEGTASAEVAKITGGAKTAKVAKSAEGVGIAGVVGVAGVAAQTAKATGDAASAEVVADVEVATPAKIVPQGTLIEVRTKKKPQWLLEKVETKVRFYNIQWLADLQESSMAEGYKNYLIQHNIAGIGYSSLRYFHFIADHAHFFDRLKRKILSFLRAKTNQYLSLHSGGLAMVLMSGEKNYLSKEVRQDFIETGTYHVLAVSGLHVGLWGTFFYQLFRLLFRFSRRTSTILTLFLALPFFIFLTTGPVSMWRAYLFAVIGGLLFLSDRSVNMLKIFIVIFFLFLFFSPQGFLLLYSLSFQLSFSAVLGILLILPCLGRYFQERYNLPTKFFLISVVCQCATFPFSFYTFARLHLFAPFYNFFVVPPMFLFLFLLFFFILSPFAWLSQALGYVLDFVGKSMLVMLDFPLLNDSFLHFDESGSIFSPYPFLLFGTIFFALLFYQYRFFFQRGEA